MARAPATAPTPWAVVSRLVADAMPRAPAVGEAMCHHRNERDEGRCEERYNSDRAYRRATARLGKRRSGAYSKRSEQADLVGASRWRGQVDEEECHDDGEEGHGVGDEGDRVAEGRDRDPRQRRADDSPEIELRRVE